jgi:hypothetical protein
VATVFGGLHLGSEVLLILVMVKFKNLQVASVVLDRKHGLTVVAGQRYNFFGRMRSPQNQTTDLTGQSQ